MTEASFLLNCERGVTGWGSGTCLAAALDRISHKAEVSARTYQGYKDLRTYFVRKVGDGANHIPQDFVRMQRSLYGRLWQDLRADPKKTVYRRASSLNELERVLGKLLNGGFRVSVTLMVNAGSTHAVGLMKGSRPGLYIARSTSIPWDSAAVTTVEVWDYLYRVRLRKRPNTAKSTYAAANIVALPPE